MQYFEHSTDAAADFRVMQLRLQCGGSAVDAYWYLLEQLYHNESRICTSDASAMRMYAHMLCTTETELVAWIDAMVSLGLFERDETGEHIYSQRAERNIDAYHERVDNARSAASKRWDGTDAKRTNSKRNAPAKRTQSRPNANQKGSNAKRITTPSEDGAGAGEPAPPSEPTCPRCGAFTMKRRGDAIVCRDGACGFVIKDDQSPHCPLCDGKLSQENGMYECRDCGVVKPSAVMWR